MMEATSMSSDPGRRDPRRANVPAAHRSQLANGLEVVVAPLRGAPYLCAHLILQSGAVHDPVGSEGRAAFCSQMLRHGTERYGETELSELLDTAAVRLGTTTFPDYVDLGGDVTTVDPAAVDTFFEALEETLLRPTFPAEEVEKVRTLRLGRLERIADDNGQLAVRAFRLAVFGESLVGRPASGTVDSLRALKRADLLEHHERHYRPEGAILGIAGDISVEEALERAERHFGAWHGRAPAPDLGPAPPTPDGLRIVLVDKQDPALSQVHFRVGHPSPVRFGSPDFFPYRLAAQVLGGDFSARLNQRLRVQEGLTYGARYRYRVGGRLPASSAAATYVELSKLVPALEMTFEELARFRSEGPGADELRRARDSVVLSFPFRFETPAGTLEQHLWTVRERLGNEFLSRYQATVDETPDPAVADSAARHFPTPETSVVTVVANASTAAALRPLLPAGREPEVVSLAALGCPGRHA